MKAIVRLKSPPSTAPSLEHFFEIFPLVNLLLQKKRQTANIMVPVSMQKTKGDSDCGSPSELGTGDMSRCDVGNGLGALSSTDTKSFGSMGLTAALVAAQTESSLASMDTSVLQQVRRGET